MQLQGRKIKWRVVSGRNFLCRVEVWSRERRRSAERYFDPLTRLGGPGSDGLVRGPPDSAARWTPLPCLPSQITSRNVTFAGFAQTSSLIRFLVCCLSLWLVLIRSKHPNCRLSENSKLFISRQFQVNPGRNMQPILCTALGSFVTIAAGRPSYPLLCWFMNMNKMQMPSPSFPGDEHRGPLQCSIKDPLILSFSQPKPVANNMNDTILMSSGAPTPTKR